MDTTVYRNNQPVLKLNSRLIEKQGLTQAEVDIIKELHVRRNEIEENLQTCRLEERRVLLECWTDNQYKLQSAWRFPEDAKFHRFWDIDGCDCPKMDNDDAYPTGYYVVSQACRIHGP